MIAMMRCLLAALIVLSAVWPAAAADNPDAKLLEFVRHGEWEAWCVDRKAEPAPRCFVTQSVVYSPRPNFAAMVLYFHPPGEDGHPRAEFGMEAQSWVFPGTINVDGERIVSRWSCLKPGTCAVDGENADAVIGKLRNGGVLNIHHYDYGYRAVENALDLEGFDEAWQAMVEWAAALKG